LLLLLLLLLRADAENVLQTILIGVECSACGRPAIAKRTSLEQRRLANVRGRIMTTCKLCGCVQAVQQVGLK
jgi:hypothetical protein